MNRNRKKKQKKTEEKLLIETSMQEERAVKPNSAPSTALKEATKGRKSDSSYYVLYEYRTGLVLSLIEFFYHVKLHGRVEDAIAEWSDRFGRDPKRKVILESMMLRLFRAIPSEKEVYLRRTEAVIDYLLTIFNVGIGNMVGGFRPDALVTFPIRGRESYKEFMTLYNKRTFIPLREFWERHASELGSMVAAEDDFREKDKKMHRYLAEIQEDVDRADLSSRCKGIGDAVITVDCPKSHRIVTADEVFEVLCGSIGKKLCLIRGKKKESLKIEYFPAEGAQARAA